MPKRPALKVGDVVRLSKRAKKTCKLYANSTMVVEKVSGDGSEGRLVVKCCTFSHGKFIGVANFLRLQLWATGYNVLSKTTPSKTKPADLPVCNDGLTHCAHCNQPTKFIQGFGAKGYNVCQNRVCAMYDR